MYNSHAKIIQKEIAGYEKYRTSLTNITVTLYVQPPKSCHRTIKNNIFSKYLKSKIYSLPVDADLLKI